MAPGIIKANDWIKKSQFEFNVNTTTERIERSDRQSISLSLDNPEKRIEPIAKQFGEMNVSPKLISTLISNIKYIKTISSSRDYF